MPIPAQQPVPETGLTAIEIRILQKVKNVLPLPFLNREAFGDIDDVAMNRRILGYIDLVIDNMNWVQPVTGYTIKYFPQDLDGTLVLGVNAFTAMFMQLKWTMNDFSYTDNGFSISLDRVTKLGTSYANLLKLYQDQVVNIKNYLWSQSVIVLGTPRYQNQLGQFVRATFGMSF
jgi:hypothetical protein